MLIRRLLLAAVLAAPVAVAATAGADTPMFTITSDPPGGDGFSTPPTIAQNSAQVQFVPTDPRTSYEYSCQLFPAGGAATSCQSPFMVLNMPEGQNMLSVTATDPGTGLTQNVRVAWLVDTSAPKLTLSNQVGGQTPGSTVDLGYNVVDGNDQPNAMRMRCTVDGVVAASCGQPFVVSGLSDGQHTLTVTATDPAGNESNTLSGTWVVDTHAPKVTLAALPVATTAGRVTVHWSATDPTTGVSGFTVRYRTAKWNGGFGAWNYPSELYRIPATSADLSLTAGTTYCMQAQAFDKVDNTSAWTAARCVARALDDTAMTLGDGWKRVKAKGFIGGSFATASKKGVSLTLPKTTLDRIGVVAMKCSTCGSLRVSVGSTTIGTVNLAAPATSRQLVMLPAFPARTGQVKLTTLSSKAVRVDGLVATRA